MSKRFKKISLKIEYLNLELEEVEELAEKYLEEFNKEFYHEIAYVKSTQKPQKTNPIVNDDSTPPTSPLIQKIYRNLAKILHPDVSQLKNAEREYKKVTKCYDNHDLVGLLTPRRVGGIAYDIITLILYFNAISEPGAEGEDATAAAASS